MKFNRFLPLFFLLLFIVSCKKDPATSFVNFKGHMDNVNIDSVYVMINNREKAFVLDADGNFSDTIQLKHEGYLTFSDGRNELPIYLIPGDDLHLNADYLDYENSIKFTGKGSVRNNFIIEKENKIVALLSNEKEFYSKPASEYQQSVKVHYQNFLQDLEDIKSEVEASFYDAEKKNLHYEYLMNLYLYQDAYAYFNNQIPVLSESFTKEINALDLNNEEDFDRFPVYRYLVSYVLDDQLKDDSLTNVVKNIKSQKIKDVFLLKLVQDINQNSTEAETVYQTILANTSNPKIVAEAELMKDKLDAAKSLSVPDFSFDNIDDKEFKLSDYKDHLIYIDLWATWCRPCFMEFPHMKKLAEEYQDEKIFFLGISIDNERNKAKWKQTVKEIDFNFEQVFAGENNVVEDTFLRQLDIRYIPRFVLIGKNGQMISAEAPTPSSPAIRKLINEFLKS